MKYLIFFIALSILTRPALAQNMGHPGGGVANSDNPIFINLKCANSLSKAKDLENEFMKSWEKKYKRPVDFFLFMRELNGKFLVDDLQTFLISDSVVKNNVCENEFPKKFGEIVFERPSFEKEIKILQDLMLSWEVGIANIRQGNLCYNHFSERKSEYESLLILIKNYKKTAKK